MVPAPRPGGLVRPFRLLAPGLALAVVYAVATTVGPTSSTRVNDLYVYSVFISLVRDGQLPYLDFGYEYPPLSVVPIVLPDLAGGSYATWLGVEMGLAWIGVQACVGALAGRRAAWVFVLSPLLVGAQLRTHFDAVPAAMTIAALVLLARDRPVGGLAMLGVGGLTKLFPLLLLPIGVAWLLGRGERRGALLGTLACAAVVLVGTLPFAGGGLVDMVRFHLDRPVQIESTPASIVFALGDPVITGTTATPDRFKSNGVDDDWAAPAQALCVLAMAALIAFAIAAAARDPRPDRLIDCALIAVLAFVGLGKVLSPQYVMWIAPFAAIAWGRGDRQRAVLLALPVVLTQTWFPERYFDLINVDRSTVWLVTLRNLALLTALAATVTAVVRGGSGTGPEGTWRSGASPRSSAAGAPRPTRP